MTNLNKGINEVKQTKEIDNILRDGGYLVDVMFHKVGTTITISPQVLGIEVAGNEELASFFDQFVRNAQISWLGRNDVDIRKAESIAKSVHNRKIRDSLDGKHYIPKSKLPAFKDFLRTKRDEYFVVRDNLIDNYDLNVRSFKRKLEEDFLSETITDVAQRDKIVKLIMDRVPSKEKVYESFKVEQDYMLFAMMTELVDDEDKDAAIESANIRMNRVNGNTLAVVFDKVNIVINAIAEGRYSKRHTTIIKDTAIEVEERNVFSHSGLVDLKEHLLQIGDNSDLSEFESLVGRIYYLFEKVDELDQLSLASSLFNLKQLEFLSNEYK